MQRSLQVQIGFGIGAGDTDAGPKDEPQRMDSKLAVQPGVGFVNIHLEPWSFHCRWRLVTG